METPDVAAVTVRAAHNANICQHEDGKSGGVLIGLQVENVESFKLKMGLEPLANVSLTRYGSHYTFSSNSNLKRNNKKKTKGSMKRTDEESFFISA